MALDETTRLRQWVISLAVSVACCAVLFVVFAAFLLDTQRQYVETKVRVEYLEERLASAESMLMNQANNLTLVMRKMKEAEHTTAQNNVQPAPAIPETPAAIEIPGTPPASTTAPASP